jgi:L-cysteine/cystine lyase
LIDVSALRQQIPATQHVRYFNAGWAGPIPQPVIDAIEQQFQLETTFGTSAPPARERYSAAIVNARAAFARVLGADLHEVSLTENTTRGLNIVFSGLAGRLRRGDHVVTTDTEHHSGLIPLYELRRRNGIDLTFVHLNAAGGAAGVLNDINDAITPRTKLIVVSHIMHTTGVCLPIGQIQQIAHDRGVQVLVDAAQTPGHLVLDMHGWGCDYYALPGHKWLLGPAGTGALYVRSDLIPDLPPAHTSSHAAVSFDSRGGYEPKVGDAAKYELSSFNGPLMAGAAAAVGFLTSIGIHEIAARVTMLSDRLRAALSAIPGVEVVSPPSGDLACGLVVFSVNGQPSGPIAGQLWEQHKVVLRAAPEPPTLRASVDFFNTEAELDDLVEAIRRIAAE